MSDELKRCPFCGGEARLLEAVGETWVHCMTCGSSSEMFGGIDSADKAVAAWNARAERTCRKVPGKMHYGERRPKCSECGYGLGDSRWIFCPQCGAKVVG